MAKHARPVQAGVAHLWPGAGKGGGPISDVLSNARRFILTHARLLERRLFEVRFGRCTPGHRCPGRARTAIPMAGSGTRWSQLRCPDSRPLFVEVGLAAVCEAGCRDQELACSVCPFLESISDARGLVPPILETVFSPRMLDSSHRRGPDSNPTAGICGLLHYQGIRHPWLSRATETCCAMLTPDPPLKRTRS